MQRSATRVGLDLPESFLEQEQKREAAARQAAAEYLKRKNRKNGTAETSASAASDRTQGST